MVSTVFDLWHHGITFLVIFFNFMAKDLMDWISSLDFAGNERGGYPRACA